MNNTFEKRFYTPQFTETASVTVRRLAWALNLNMVQTMQEIISFIAQLLNKQKVCLACQDNTKCAACAFAKFPQSKLCDFISE